MKLTFEEYLYESFGPLTDSRIKESAIYSLMAPGKRIRPLLLLAVLKDYGCNPEMRSEERRVGKECRYGW